MFGNKREKKFSVRKNSFLMKLLFSQRALAVLGLVILILIITPLLKNIEQRNKINKEVSDMEKEIEHLESKNNDLRKFVDYLGSDQFLEEQARLNFGLKKNGEEVVVIDNRSNLGDKKATTTDNLFDIPQSEDNGTIVRKNNPKKWMEFFFKKK